MESPGISRRGLMVGGIASAALGTALATLGPGSARASATAAGAGPDPAKVPHTYFAFDTGLWNGHLMRNCEIRMGHFIKDDANNPLFREGVFESPRLPWEPRYDNGYPNVFWDPEHRKYRCYYTLFVRDPASLNTSPEERRTKDYVISGRQTGLCYAESTDGVHWVKPKLGIVEFDGSTDNNILFTDVQGTSVLYDPADPDPARRYKLLTLKEKGGTSLCTAFSADGVQFTPLRPWPANSPVPGGDCHNLVFRDSASGQFVLITRLWDSNIRVSAMSTSEDFLNWTKPVEIHRGSGFESQIYSMPVFEYEGLYLGLASVYHDGDTALANYDTVDLDLQWSVNTTEWNQVALADSTFIPHGPGTDAYPRGAFDSSVIFASVPILEDDKLWFYYMGGKGRHTGWRETSLGRGYVQKDRFAYYGSRLGNQPMELTTQGLNFHADNLQILADIEPGGWLTAELRNTAGTVVQAGFEASRSRLEDTGGGWRQIRWEGKSVRELDPKGFFALRLVSQKAKIWAVRGDIHVRPLKYEKP
ncbi:hypothetical protein GA0074695_5202 [Micromonospora viridifaciens]|uniref:Uncharacterized protein n=1 Tax=Micromonospora viridifaciens TaxID=1881 RepID=A0A1C4Z7L6_MICVI|nr:hypothetical protein [Micromonospora viridifaciens]SCF28965.1 hypothetical protein GA0074695_5202 [Micromonospora viridifaciens]